MLDINMEFRKGVLFVRLIGVLDKYTAPKVKKELTSIIENNGIKYLVFNIEGLEYIDIEGISFLKDNYHVIANNKGRALVCGIKNDLVKFRIENSTLLKYMYETSNEITALNIINL